MIPGAMEEMCHFYQCPLRHLVRLRLHWPIKNHAFKKNSYSRKHFLEGSMMSPVNANVHSN